MTTLVATPRSATVLSALPTATHELVAAARHSLTQALMAHAPAERYAAAHLAALRAAAAVIAARGPVRRRSRSRVRSVWLVLPEVAVELTEWADFFATGARKRALAEAGVPCVSAREADDLLRDAQAFVDRVIAFLQPAHQEMLPIAAPAAAAGAPH